MEIADLERNAETAAGLLQAMGNANRLMILCHLLAGEATVGELTRRVGMSQSALSQQLAKLRNLKLVETRREAQQIFYSLASAEVRRLLMTLHEIYCEPGVRSGASPVPSASI